MFIWKKKLKNLRRVKILLWYIYIRIFNLKKSSDVLKFHFDTSTWPLRQAQCKGVLFSELQTLISCTKNNIINHIYKILFEFFMKSIRLLVYLEVISVDVLMNLSTQKLNRNVKVCRSLFEVENLKSILSKIICWRPNPFQNCNFYSNLIILIWELWHTVDFKTKI